MIPEREDEHVKKGLKLLLEQFRKKPVIEGFLKAQVLNRAQDLENELWRVLWGWYLGNAEGKQLDDLGAIAGELREGRSDAEYEAAIRVRIRINRSKGRTVDILEVASLLVDDFLYNECRMLDWQVDVYGIPTATAIGLIRALAQTRAATSYGAVVTSTREGDEVMRFGSTAVGGPTYLMGSVYGGTSVDLKLPTALPTNPPYRRS